jgi:hypothetical protein
MYDENNKFGGIQGLRQVRDKSGHFFAPGTFWRRHLWQIIAGALVVILLFTLLRQNQTPQLSPQTAVVVCQSGSTDNWSGWHLRSGWKQLNNMLLNDGSNGGYNGRSTLLAPASCQPKTMDYAVEAAIQVVNFGSSNYSGFGINVRSGPSQTDPPGYTTFIDSSSGANISVVGGDVLKNAPFNPGTNSHVFRAEVKGNTITFLIDGATVLSVVDNTYISTGQVGLWCANAQIEMSSFKVFKL